AVAALRRRRASLLAAGVTRVDGDYHRGDVVDLRGPDGGAIGRGLAFCDADTARSWLRAGAGTDPEDRRRRDPHILVRREAMVLEPEPNAPSAVSAADADAAPSQETNR
ncbi:MAG: PUA domain-containing protein, partial [Acidobacteriota bacterium]